MKFELHTVAQEPTNLVDLIAANSQASKAQIKKALNLGGGWVTKKGQKTKKRSRRAKLTIQTGDKVSFYFNDQLLSNHNEPAEPLDQNKHWGLWYKPAGVPSQGTLYGDVGCMLEQVKSQRNSQQVYLVHRLDTETAGIMLFAYSKKAAAVLSQLWQNNQVSKTYQAEVLGQPSSLTGSIETPLDGKSAVSHYRMLFSLENTSILEIKIETGRYHQIRRHLEAIGHPIMGDPKYGKNNKNKEGLKLISVGLSFLCPLNQQSVNYALPEQWQLI